MKTWMSARLHVVEGVKTEPWVGKGMLGFWWCGRSPLFALWFTGPWAWLLWRWAGLWMFVLELMELQLRSCGLLRTAWTPTAGCSSTATSLQLAGLACLDGHLWKGCNGWLVRLGVRGQEIYKNRKKKYKITSNKWMLHSLKDAKPLG